MDISDALIEKVERAIFCAENNISKLDELNITGMSTRKIRILLNELIDSKTKYLEVGVWHGSTFVSALYKNTPKFACAIDNFAYFRGNVDIFKENCAKNNVTDYVLFEAESFSLTAEEKNLLKDIDLYFYDGGHSEQQQEDALTYYYDNLATDFIFIVDDWAHVPAILGTRNAIQKTNLQIIKEWELPGMSKEYHITDPKKSQNTEWWNGLYIAVCKKSQ